MLDAEIILDSPRVRRAELISDAAEILYTDTAIERARKLSASINSFINEYFDLKLREDRRSSNGSVLRQQNLESAITGAIADFRPVAIRKLRETLPTVDELLADPKNPYELAGASKLAFANRATRNLSTTMGMLWEKIASVSPYAISPELEFGVKIKGIDLIVRNFATEIVEYVQLKTQKNTLTGSQSGRSKEELAVHDNPVFCASFALQNWTFRSDHIPRIAGIHFWERIGIDYDIFEKHVKALILELEDIYVGMLSE